MADHDRAENNATILIFGASGDLTARKLLPALFHLACDGFLPEDSIIVGLARREKSDEQFRNEMFQGVSSHARSGTIDPTAWKKFASRLFYHRIDITEQDQYPALADRLSHLESENGVSGNRIAYMATTPELFLPAVSAIDSAEISPNRESQNWLRVVFEKPFGHNLNSAQDLTSELSKRLSEDQIYRIDHYLGKETVQNLLLFRFGNSIFEPLLNRNHVDHVQITMAESQGIEGNRGGYYDSAGALRDVLQNHILQLLCLIAMEPPALFRAREIRDEKLKVLEALSVGNAQSSYSERIVSGQYIAGQIDGDGVIGYRDEQRISKDSVTETFLAMQVGIDNWRWSGVPFFLRTGKRLPHRVTEIAIQFKRPPLNLFSTVECEGDMCDLVEARPNTLVFHIQPQEAISLNFSTKRPGMQYQIQPVTMDFEYQDAFDQGLPEAYERLLLDVLRGDSTLFTRSDELEEAWRFVTPILDHWEQTKAKPEFYPAGSWGPKAADQLIQSTGRRWHNPIDQKQTS